MLLDLIVDYDIRNYQFFLIFLSNVSPVVSWTSVVVHHICVVFRYLGGFDNHLYVCLFE